MSKNPWFYFNNSKLKVARQSNDGWTLSLGMHNFRKAEREYSKSPGIVANEVRKRVVDLQCDRRITPKISDLCEMPKRRKGMEFVNPDKKLSKACAEKSSKGNAPVHWAVATASDESWKLPFLHPVRQAARRRQTLKSASRLVGETPSKLKNPVKVSNAKPKEPAVDLPGYRNGVQFCERYSDEVIKDKSHPYRKWGARKKVIWHNKVVTWETTVSQEYIADMDQCRASLDEVGFTNIFLPSERWSAYEIEFRRTFVREGATRRQKRESFIRFIAKKTRIAPRGSSRTKPEKIAKLVVALWPKSHKTKRGESPRLNRVSNDRFNPSCFYTTAGVAEVKYKTWEFPKLALGKYKSRPLRAVAIGAIANPSRNI